MASVSNHALAQIATLWHVDCPGALSRTKDRMYVNKGPHFR